MKTIETFVVSAVLIGALPLSAIQPPEVAVAGESGAALDATRSTQQAQEAKEHEHRTQILLREIQPGAVPLLGWNRQNVPWLGFSVSETPEALNAQLGLERGAGLTVDFVAKDSPAAEGGFQKNDVLVKLEDQLLVHPAQFRKLVQSRKEGEKVTLVYYRGGKEQSASVTMGKSPEPTWAMPGAELGPEWGSRLKELEQQIKVLPLEPMMRDQMRGLRESLSNLKIDQQKVQEELRASLEEARRSLEQALSSSSHLSSALDPARRALRELETSKSAIGADTKVIVRSEGRSVRSTVQADDQGTLVIIADPDPRLTAHDKDGKLLFDGPIKTQEQQQQVPPEVWGRAQPILERLQEQSAATSK